MAVTLEKSAERSCKGILKTEFLRHVYGLMGIRPVIQVKFCELCHKKCFPTIYISLNTDIFISVSYQ